MDEKKDGKRMEKIILSRKTENESSFLSAKSRSSFGCLYCTVSGQRAEVSDRFPV